MFTETVNQFSKIFVEKSAGNRIGGTYIGPGPINRCFIQSLKSIPRLANVANRHVRVSNVPTPFSDRLQNQFFEAALLSEGFVPRSCWSVVFVDRGDA